MRRLAAAIGLVTVLAGGLVVGGAGSASAHPVGNFSVNHYSGLRVAPDRLTVDHVVDTAEIPAYQTRPAIDTDRDGTLAEAELAAYAQRECLRSADGLRVTVDGEARPLSVTRSGATTPPGQAGLATLRLTCTIETPLDLRGSVELSFRDTLGTDRVGWREVTAVGDGATLVSSDAPTDSVSARLTAYPENLLASPLDRSEAELTVRPGGARAGATAEEESASRLSRGADAITVALQKLAGRPDLTVGIALLALLVAVVSGAVHALAPGHGKTVMAAYLVGRRGDIRATALIGATVTVTHTAGVLVLGAVLSASSSLVSERLFPLLGALSGLLLAGIGVGLLIGALHRRRLHAGVATPVAAAGVVPVLTHSASEPVTSRSAMTGGGTAVLVEERPAPAHHEHDHDHEHAPHEHRPAAPAVAMHRHGLVRHSHGPRADGDVPSRRGLVAMGFVGGMVPAPSALIVLLGAIALGRAWFGVLLVVVYGLGMAATLTLAGVLLIRARGALDRRAAGRSHRWTTLLSTTLPVVTAVIITVVGLGLVVGGLSATVALN